VTTAVLPGAAIGVLGGGQLGRMLALVARRMGYRVHVFTPEEDSPAGQIADQVVVASYDDLDAVRRFADAVRVVTLEFENVSVGAATAVADRTLLRPGYRALEVAQHRLREKAFLSALGVPVTPFAPIRTPSDLAAGLAAIGTPSILKTASLGYDGKGQVPIRDMAQADAAWASIDRREAVLEAFIDLACEISVVGARSVDGGFAHVGPIENVHVHHILDVSVIPATVPPALAADAVAMTRAVMESLDYVGVLCVEFFVASDGRLLVNELAPRTHNSGHLTIDACRTSQFEQQLRAICGLPLGTFDLRQPAAMANLLGDVWEAGEPNWAAALSVPGVVLHLYGKTTPRPGRKMGHLTALAPTVAEARERVTGARASLRRR
jgi:5-(carboxyamino)imidazole ribonucleotide synthase